MANCGISSGEQMEEVCLKMIEVGGRELVDVVDGQARTGCNLVYRVRIYTHIYIYIYIYI